MHVSATEAYINNCSNVNRVARLAELAKNIQSQELLSIFLPKIVKELTTYQFLLNTCQDEENVNLTKLSKEFTEVIQQIKLNFPQVHKYIENSSLQTNV